MPIYEYLCKSCDTTFEKLKSSSNRHTAHCPICNKKSRKLMSKASVKVHWPPTHTDIMKHLGSSNVTDRNARTENLEAV